MFLFPCMKHMAGRQPTEQLDGLQKRSWTFDATSAAKAQVALRTRFSSSFDSFCGRVAPSDALHI